MTLEDVINAKKKYGKAEETAEMYRQNPGDSQLIGRLYNLENRTPPEIDVLYQQTPYEIGRKVNEKLRGAQVDLVGKVEENYDAVVNELTKKPDVLYHTILETAPVSTGDAEHDKKAKLHKKIQQFKAEIAARNPESYMRDLAESDKEVYEVIMRRANGNPELLLNLAKYKLNKFAGQLAEEFSEGKGEKAKLDPKALKTYLNQSMDAYDDGKKASAYFALGTYLGAK